MPGFKVLITVATYPLPSRSYDELVCVAGVLENGNWIRIYPVPLKFLRGLRTGGLIETFKYNWIELELKRRSDDPRPESHSPVNYDFKDISVSGKAGTEHNWSERKKYCLTRVYSDITKLIADSRDPLNISLATFKPSRILSFDIEPDEREWKDEWKELRRQRDLFDEDKPPEILIPKLPYKFYYHFVDDAGLESRMMIEDWEIGALYWNCLRNAEGKEPVALEKVREKYEQEFIQQKDIFLFLGTTKEWHLRRARNPFVIIGVFYPKKEFQASLF
jgi:hypothetical protein